MNFTKEPGQPVPLKLKIVGTGTVVKAATRELKDEDPIAGSDEHAEAISALSGEKDQD